MYKNIKNEVKQYTNIQISQYSNLKEIEMPTFKKVNIEFNHYLIQQIYNNTMM